MHFYASRLGAFGAHGLKQRLSADMLAVYQTGVQYHFYHALGLIAVGLILLHFLHPDRWHVGLADASRNYSVFRQPVCAESDGHAWAWYDHAIWRRGVPERMGDACVWGADIEIMSSCNRWSCIVTLYNFFAPCPRGLEPALVTELERSAPLPCCRTRRRRAVPGRLADCYRANLESRIASRILWQVASEPYVS